MSRWPSSFGALIFQPARANLDAVVTAADYLLLRSRSASSRGPAECLASAIRFTWVAGTNAEKTKIPSLIRGMRRALLYAHHDDPPIRDSCSGCSDWLLRLCAAVHDARRAVTAQVLRSPESGCVWHAGWADRGGLDYNPASYQLRPRLRSESNLAPDGTAGLGRSNGCIGPRVRLRSRRLLRLPQDGAPQTRTLGKLAYGWCGRRERRSQCFHGRRQVMARRGRKLGSTGLEDESARFGHGKRDSYKLLRIAPAAAV